MAKTVADVLKLGKDVKMVDIRFIDLPGTWQHFTIPVRRLDKELFEEGMPFDGSSIRGFQEIHESDMLLIPDPNIRLHRSCCRYPDAGPHLRRIRPDHAPAL